MKTSWHKRIEVAHSGLTAPDQQKMRIPHNLSFNRQSKFSWSYRIVNSYNPYSFSICIASVSKKKRKEKTACRSCYIIPRSIYGRGQGAPGAQGSTFFIGELQSTGLNERVPHLVNDLNPPLSCGHGKFLKSTQYKLSLQILIAKLKSGSPHQNKGYIHSREYPLLINFIFFFEGPSVQ